MRRVAKVDVNQKEIVNLLRQLGFEILHIHQLKNCCDVIASKGGLNHLIEIKNGKGNLTEGEEKFHDRWKAPVHILRDVENVLKFCEWHNRIIRSGIPDALLETPSS